jgi:hypothetical protein
LCTQQGEVHFIDITVGSTWNTSTYQTYVGSFSCPDDFEHFCGAYQVCPNLCSNNGYCLGGQCYCLSGYSGEDCSNGTTVITNPGTTCNVCTDCSACKMYPNECYGCGQCASCS